MSGARALGESPRGDCNLLVVFEGSSELLCGLEKLCGLSDTFGHAGVRVGADLQCERSLGACLRREFRSETVCECQSRGLSSCCGDVLDSDTVAQPDSVDGGGSGGGGELESVIVV